MRYEAPTTLDQAVALLAAAGPAARVLAGGTDLLVQMRTDVIEPSVVIDIKGIGELRQITMEGGAYRIGAAVTGAELKEHPKLKDVWPGVVEAANRASALVKLRDLKLKVVSVAEDSGKGGFDCFEHNLFA